MALSADFGRRLKELRSLKNMTQAQLAERCGLSVQYLGRVERGQASPSFSVMEQFCAALETEPANLFLFSPPPVAGRLEKQPPPTPLHPDYANTFVTWTGVWRRDLVQKTDIWSDSLLQMLGYTSNSRKRSMSFFLEHVQHHDRARVGDAIQNVLAGRRISDFEFTIVRKDGPQRIIIAHCDHLPGPDADVQFVCLIFMDVTEWRRLQNELLRNREQLEEHVATRTRELHDTVTSLEQAVHRRTDAERRLHIATLVAEASNDVLAFVDTEQRYVFVNRRYQSLFGMSQEAIAGKAVAELFPPSVYDEVVRPRMLQALGGEQAQFQAWLDFPGKAPLFMDVTYTPFMEREKVAGVVVTRPTT